MTVGDILEAIFEIISLPFKIFTIEFWEGVYDLKISGLLFIIFLFLTLYSFYKADELKKEQKKEANIDNERLKFWKESFWLFERNFPKPISFIVCWIIYYFFLNLS
jgi:hypothetical protein